MRADCGQNVLAGFRCTRGQHKQTAATNTGAWAIASQASGCGMVVRLHLVSQVCVGLALEQHHHHLEVAVTGGQAEASMPYLQGER
jgi:hypothetical protein